MRRDIINAPALQGSIEEALEGLPTTLQDYKTPLQACLRRGAETHTSVRKAHRRKGDPGWAQRKFDEGHPLHRFRERDRDELIELIRDQFDRLGQVAELAKGGGPCAHAAAAFLKGLPHHRGDLQSLGWEARGLIQRAQTVALRAKRYDVLRPPLEVEVGSLVGRRCASIDEIVRLGREAGNCLAHNEGYRERFASGTGDVWSLRDGDRLVAVLEMDRARSLVDELKGPANVAVGLRDVRNVALFCERQGLGIGRRCEGLLLDYAAPPLVGPTVVEVGGCVALYAEWPTAVRIDLSRKTGAWLTGRGPAKTLALAFDPDRPCAEAILGGDDPREAVAEFGRKRLRGIVGSVARAQATPTLVQHRLLALAA